jgi:anti-sigma regulatory factor (Ser/Thr protein kinase)
MNNKITLTLPASENWLTMINETVRHYAKLHDFSKQAEDDLTQS